LPRVRGLRSKYIDLDGPGFIRSLLADLQEQSRANLRRVIGLGLSGGGVVAWLGGSGRCCTVKSSLLRLDGAWEPVALDRV